MYDSASYEYDDLDDYRARYYDPTIGRFVSEDPMRFMAAGTNFYAYVLNNPVLLVDPLGLCPDGTHAATPNEISKILSAANDIVGEGLSYKDIRGAISLWTGR